MLVTVENIDFINRDKKLTHLSEEQIVSLINSYYEGENVSKLISDYEINTTTSNLVKIFPAFLTDKQCEKCHSPLVIPFASRTYSKYVKERERKCSKCGHTDSPDCMCDSCQEERTEATRIKQEREKQLNEKKRQILSDYYSEEKWMKISEMSLTMEERLYLAVILRTSLSENTEYIVPLSEVEGKLAPTHAFELDVIQSLTRRRILVPSLLSSLNDFKVTFSPEDETKYNIHFYIYEVHYRLNIQPQDNDYNAMIKRLLYPNFRDEENVKQFCFEMWQRIALNECLQYLLYQMEKVGYNFQPGEKTVRVFEELLEHFSVSQIYSVIYRSVANSTQRYQAREITKLHAQNSVITGCESYGQRAIAQGWNLSHYSRLKDLPETHVSNVLFTSIMQISELGFTEKPSPHFRRANYLTHV